MDVLKKYICEVCKFSTNNKFCLETHLSTKKHLRNSNPNPNPKLESEKRYNCKTCDKSYKYASGLSIHTKICNKKINSAPFEETAAILVRELKIMNEHLDLLKSCHQPPVNNITTINNNNFKINVFLNETCKNAINLDCFIKNLMFELADPKLMIGNYVDGTCNILQRNLDELPLNKRPLHCMEGEDPNQQLMHIRQDNKWNIGTYVNWLEQIHADDDDDVVEKNPIYYALKTIDDEKLKYLGYNFYQDVDYKLQHGRLNREVVRQDLKKDVYKRLLKIITLDTNKLIQ